MAHKIFPWVLLVVFEVALTPTLCSQAVGGSGPSSAQRNAPRAVASQQRAAHVPHGGIPAYPLRGGFCTLLAPADWKLNGILPDGKGIAARNSSFTAAYTIEAYTPVLIQYGQPYCADPRICVQSKVAKSSQDSGLGPIVNTSQLQQYGDMFVQEFESATRHTVVMYSFYPMSMGGYVLVFRMAEGPKERWPSYGTIATLVAGSIRCQAQYTPSPSTGIGRAGRSASAESTYNVQLGTEYAHDPETGEVFFMRHASDWRETGPDGPGYYRETPGGPRKLAPGLGD